MGLMESSCSRASLVRELQKHLENTKEDNRRLDEELKRIKDDNTFLRKGKDEAEQRLGNLMYAKMYDNNPAIADLSDQYGPAKLSEQFSRLYYNEWNSAYDYLQTLGFTEREIVEILLELIMESNEFCACKLEETWAFVQHWFLVMDSSSVETIKDLKDGRKQKLIDKVPKIQEEFYEHVRELFINNTRLTEVFNSTPLEVYINECIRCCLMMNACDPPVIIEIPGWKPLKDRGVKFETSVHNYTTEGRGRKSMSSFQPTTQEPGQNTGNNHHLTSDNNQQSSVSTRGQKQKPADDTAFVDDRNKMEEIGASKRTIMEESIVKVTFDKTKFREYTCRGEYVDFFVWPVIYLYRNGELLDKGVAQVINR
ncbi:hypothetical protein DPMN_044327 [Dreissena polymorpha]|uniref:Mitochondria-eating protein C-terminal domain-containing protein n=1 Tax=Dreissena polymorpha TaxID=45954 RepID=A0A9D4D5M4_DREPO|nr:hypothetical protein DPMN_044327 [Dreissena polymorpha]